MKIKIDRPLAMGSKNFKFVECIDNGYIYETDEATAKLVLSLRFAKSEIIEEDKTVVKTKKAKAKVEEVAEEEVVEEVKVEEVVD